MMVQKLYRNIIKIINFNHYDVKFSLQRFTVDKKLSIRTLFCTSEAHKNNFLLLLAECFLMLSIYTSKFNFYNLVCKIFLSGEKLYMISIVILDSSNYVLLCLSMKGY